MQFAFDLKAGNFDVPNHASDYDLGTEHFNAVELLKKVRKEHQAIFSCVHGTVIAIAVLVFGGVILICQLLSHLVGGL